MKVFKKIILVMFFSLIGSTLYAQEEKETFLQLSLFNPVQIFNDSYNVGGVRINLLYGSNNNMSGLDLGLINKVKWDYHGGYQGGMVNFVGNDFNGWQDGLVNITRKNLIGLQTGVYNENLSLKGVQYGLVNITEKFSGLQLGLLNYTQVFSGVQLGVLNISSRRYPIRFFPIVNVNF